MRTVIAVLCVSLAGCGPQANNAATSPPPPAGYVLDTPPPPPPGFVVDAPAKEEFIADQEAIAEFNQRQQDKADAEWQARRAEAAADARTSRLVEAEKATQRKLDAIADKMD